MSSRGTGSAITVNRAGVFDHRLDIHPSASFQAPEKAACASRMTGDSARLFNVEQDRVAVAVEPDLAHALHVARRFALAPEPATRARPIVRFAGLDGTR